MKNLSFALHSLDIGSGKNIAIMSTNSPDWAMCDYSIICTGAATVTIYPTLIAKQVKYILNNSHYQVIGHSPFQAHEVLVVNHTAIQSRNSFHQLL